MLSASSCRCMPKRASYWIATANAPARPPLDASIQTDVVIAGAGIVGLTAAALLAKAGKHVVVLEKGAIAAGVSGQTTAKVTLQHGLIYHRLVKDFGQDRAAIHVDANRAGQDFIREHAPPSADWTEADSYVYATQADRAEEMHAEVETCRQLGLPVTWQDDTELPFDTVGAVRMEDQAHFHPRHHLLELARRAEAAGAIVYEQTPVTGIRSGAPNAFQTPHGTVTAPHGIIATHVPILDRLGYVMRMQVRREYVAVGASTLPMHGMYVNCHDPRRSARPIPGEDDTAKRFGAMRDFAKQLDMDVEYEWSTQDYYPTDGVPLIGRYHATSGTLLTATGMQSWGMTMGTAAGIMLRDILLEGRSPWQALYDPFAPMRLAKALVQREQFGLAATALGGLVGRRLGRADAKALAAGDGRIIDDGLHKLAVCRTRGGKLHAVRAACTHMGCIVAWNNGEQSWDCPCHGARFAPDGAVLRGPATRPLAEAEVPEGVKP
jgi:glycine/D-amino acid oxidase-like deaminating enzyme/nitrite reductase/ring-hydroxylating ferredoxin subunit